MSDSEPNLNLDFSNTEIAFSNKSDAELKKTAWLFRMMNNKSLVSVGSKLAMFAIKARIPFTEYFVRKTVFPQFCGGETLLDCQQVIDKLYEFDTLTILDFGAEGKTDEDELDNAMNETIRAIEMAASNNSVPVVSTKFTGLIDKAVLAKMHAKEELTEGDKRNYQHLVERVEAILEKAVELGVAIFVDAEESWLQDPIDELVMQMMERYNKSRVYVYNTYQLYNRYKLEHLKRDHKRCLDAGVIFGAKMVRGAYMDKERARAQEMGYPSPIHDTKQDTDNDYNTAIRYCIDHYETIASSCASHNAESNMLQAQLIHEKGLQKNHLHLTFCQLYGMSDNITFNLANAGYNVAKYVVYGPIKDVIPYLIRRTEENASVTGEMSRELSLVEKEMKRRGLK
ncbi:MAG: proline dehydrogenase family protein [Saprospiraceae bacterium]|nr:proline dehydrogenase family protein [Saprospiraceae bacterium]MCZ2339230.1 proline dehydrogenase family protein [Chitinophagales bacterium]